MAIVPPMVQSNYNSCALRAVFFSVLFAFTSTASISETLSDYRQASEKVSLEKQVESGDESAAKVRHVKTRSFKKQRVAGKFVGRTCTLNPTLNMVVPFTARTDARIFFPKPATFRNLPLLI